jgi:hypothetical protein
MLGRLEAAATKKRRSIGGGEHQSSLREALRNRGGARALVTPQQSEAEDNEDPVKEKPQLEWLGLTPYAASSIKGVVERLRTELPNVPILPNGGKFWAGSEVDHVNGVDDLSPGRQAKPGRPGGGLMQPGLGPLAVPAEQRKKKPACGLKAALQARGGVKTAPPPSKVEPRPDPQVLANLEEASRKLSSLGGEDAATRDGLVEPSPSGSLASVREEHDEELLEAPDLEEEAAMPRSCPPGQEGGEALLAAEVAQAPASAEAEAEFVAFAEGVAVAEEDAEAAEGEAQAQVAEGEVEVAPAPLEGAAAEGHASSEAQERCDERLAQHDGESQKLAVPSQEVALSSRCEKLSSMEADAWWMHDSAGSGKSLISRRHSVGGTATPPQQPPKQVQPRPQPPEAPRKQEETTAQKELRELKLHSQDLRAYWNKNSVGFAGPQLNSSRLSKGEAQATLQRLITAGSTVDFEEVRRLRKLISEPDSGR